MPQVQTSLFGFSLDPRVFVVVGFIDCTSAVSELEEPLFQPK